MEEEGPMAWHASAVVHNGRDVAGREDGSVTQHRQSAQRCQAQGKSLHCLPLLPAPLSGRTYSPLASSSQISKKTIRSYLHWHGPALGRVMVLSFVAGTAPGQKDSLKGELDTDIWGEACDGRQGPRGGMHGGGSKAGGSTWRGPAPSQGPC